MSYPATVLEIMIASPSDTEEERQAAKNAIYEWNILHSKDKKIVLVPTGWDTHVAPTVGEHPQDIINHFVTKQCDMLISLFKYKLGTPTKKYDSGTVEEIDMVASKEKSVMLYFYNGEYPSSVVENQAEEIKRVSEFKKDIQDKAYYKTYTTTEDLENRILKDLTISINNSSLPEAQPVALPPLPQESNHTVIDSPQNIANIDTKLSSRAIVLLYAGIQKGEQVNKISCQITRNKSARIKASNYIIEDADAEKLDAWKDALYELIQHGYIDLIDTLNTFADKVSFYEITREGSRVIKELIKSNVFCIILITIIQHAVDNNDNVAVESVLLHKVFPSIAKEIINSKYLDTSEITYWVLAINQAINEGLIHCYQGEYTVSDKGDEFLEYWKDSDIFD